MNPVGAEGNIFSNLFDKVPAKRAAVAEDIAGTVLYLVSKAGVSLLDFSSLASDFSTDHCVCLSSLMWMEYHCVLMEGEYFSPMGKNRALHSRLSI
jgi:hypothetical protein